MAATSTIDSRHRFLISKLCQSLGVPDYAAEEYMRNDKVLATVQAFLDAPSEGAPQKLLFFYQPVDEHAENGDRMPGTGEPVLFLTTGDQERLRGKSVYFVRGTQRTCEPATVEQDIVHGEITFPVLESLEATLAELYLPLLSTQSSWGKNTDEATREFLGGMRKFVEGLTETVNSLHGGIELLKPDRKFEVDNKQPAFNRAASDPDTVAHYEGVLEDWCRQTEKLLGESDAVRKESDDIGPNSELDYWRSRMSKFNSITEQLKTKECKVVLGVCTAAKSRAIRRWKQIDAQITDAANEAKDNVKYLSTLEKYTEPLYNGTPSTIIDALPGLMNNVKMMHTIARYYNTTERMTNLFVKITNQMITNCKMCINAPGKLWDQDPNVLIRNLESCLRLNEAYQEQYRLTRDKLLTQPKGKQFDFSEVQIFGKFELFCKRVQKLIDVFSTVHQFSTLAEHKIDGMEALITNFVQITEEFKRKPYDLLDFQKPQFDRDYIEFNKNIQELEAALQAFINHSFDSITNTEQALNLLKQFQAILQRENLRADLDSKYMNVFHNYGLDLEAVQRIYERFKHNPPMVRNAPPVAGNITWARQLLRRIEEPMKKFQANKNIMSTKESKRIIKTYNRVARALIEFETLWHYAWIKSVDTAKSALQATLIIRHPDNRRLYVNFDREILQLIRETKWLLRLGIEIPESARIVLLQEEKFKFYYDQLDYVLREYDRVVSRILPVCRSLLKPHVEDLDRKLQPGMITLTWTSMNIDGYLHRIHTGLQRLEGLVTKINELVDNRVERNLKIISKMTLVDLHEDQSYTLEEFVSVQDKYIKSRAEVMASKNLEVENAITDLIDLVLAYQLDGDAAVLLDDVAGIRAHYSRLMYKAILNCTRNSLYAIKRRIGSRQSTGFLYVDRPFFDVDVELTIPEVSMNPSLEEIQEAINVVALSILRSCKVLKAWGVQVDDGRPVLDSSAPADANGEQGGAPAPAPAASGDAAAAKEGDATGAEGSAAADGADANGDKAGKELAESSSFYDLMAKDKAVVRMILLLTGSIEGLKKQVHDYLGTFRQYDYLWKEDMQVAYSEFMKNNPSLEDFEGEMRRYLNVEMQIAQIAPVHVIGALSLHTQSLKYSLKAEAASWKAQYAKNLHRQAKEDLEGMSTYIVDTTAQLKREIKDLDDLRTVMNVLKEIRDRESEIDLEFGPVEDMYSLLHKYEVRVPKEETDSVTELRYDWKKLRQLALSVSDNIMHLQATFKRELVRNVKAFAVDVIQFRNDYDANGPMVPGIRPSEAIDRLRQFQRMFEDRERKWNMYTAGEELFGLPLTEYPELARTKKELKLLSNLYNLYSEVITSVEDFKEELWMDVDLEIMSEKMAQFQAQCKKLPRALREWDAYKELRKTIDDYNEIAPLLMRLANKAVRNRHWQQVMQITGRGLKTDPELFRMHHLLEANLLKFREDVEEITNAAIKEQAIEDKLKQIEEDWADQVFTFANFKNRGPIILKGQETAEIMELLDESQMALGGMMTSRYIDAFKEEVSAWMNKLSTVAEVIEQWLVVQSMWSYLEAVFTAGDIAKQMPQEAKRFANIDKHWVKIMSKAYDTRNVIHTCYGNENLKNLLPHLTEQLELCQRSLAGYLEQKRNAFPRFYFVSDSVLLEVLSQGSDPGAIQAHFQSIFDSIGSVKFDVQEKATDKKRMIGIKSLENEAIPLSRTVIAEGHVEDYLRALEGEMRETVRDVIRDAAREYPSLPLAELIEKYQSQIALAAIQLMWTNDCTQALSRAKAEKNIMNVTNKKIGTVLYELTAMTTKELDPLVRTKIETLITIQVHQRDSFDDLVKKRVKDTSDFEWQKRTRFYWRPESDHMVISIADIDIQYCYEYLGCKERLVITPLTDRAYVSFSQALGMCLGGAPAGPAGTGKTETVKDLGRTLGKYVVVFNCSDQMDYKSVGRIFKGLAQSGAWGCFDEFNRILPEVLSVVALQIQSVLEAMRERREIFVFTDGQTLKLNSEVGIFVTMNPGYAGRHELPENLKSLMRPVAMMVPDRQMIIKVRLAAAGFQENGVLAKKFIVLYRLCEQQLSRQRHYDFGLRNILSVLRTAGAVKRASPGTSESVLLMRTLRDMNLSKLVAEDVPLFLALVADLFPSLKATKGKYDRIESAIKTICAELNLVMWPEWVEKVIQLYETSLVRHGIMVVGPAASGKSKIIEVLMKALTELGTVHKEVRMNPKAFTPSQMYGHLDPLSQDWLEGIFSVLWRKANRQRNNNTWMVLDGPVDSIWIESLNSVLDDNKMLTLANGDRIPMSPTVKLVFETENLNSASPATVSRSGIVFVSDSVLGWKPVTEAWLALRRGAEADQLRGLFDKYFDALLQFVRSEASAAMSLPGVCMVRTCLQMLQAVLGEASSGAAATAANSAAAAAAAAAADDDDDAAGAPAAPSGGSISPVQLERVFLFCAAWAFGGIVETTGRQKLDRVLRTMTDNLPNVATPGEEDTGKPTSVFEFFVDENTLDWESWHNRVTPWVYPDDGLDYSTLFVPTVDTMRLQFVVDLLARQQIPVLLVGSGGTGKSTVLSQYVARQTSDDHTFKRLNLSSTTTPLQLQRTLESVVEKRQGRTYGPPGGKHMTLFLDDVNMPFINEWGDQEANELLRQLLESGGFYNLDKPGEWKNITAMRYVAAMNQPGSGNNDIPNRLKRHFAIFNTVRPTQASLQTMFNAVACGKYNPDKFGAGVAKVASQLTDATITVWERTRAKLLPAPSKFHYQFNLRDLNRIFQGITLPAEEAVKAETTLVHLWRNECVRVIGDRLISLEDRSWLESTVATVAGEVFGSGMAKDLERTTYFVDFMRDPIDTEFETLDAPKIYEQVTELDTLRKRIEHFVVQYNAENRSSQLDLVLFDDAVLHLMRISRILAMPRGNALLVGVGGSGKQSLTKLAAFIAGHELFQVPSSKAYGVANLMDDLRIIYKHTGLQGRTMAFVMTDAHAKNSAFLDLVNTMLVSGEVPNLFTKDEMDAMINDLRTVVKKAKPGFVDSYDNLYKLFFDRVRDNLHVVLCFSPVGSNLRERVQKFPGLLAGCTMDWFLAWPEDALRGVAHRFIESFEMEAEAAQKVELVNHMAAVHASIEPVAADYFVRFRRNVYATPTTYLSFINSYKSIYNERRQEIKDKAQRVTLGLEKLKQAEEDVEKLKADLEKQEVELSEAQAVSHQLLAEITEKTAKAEKKKNEVQGVKNQLAAEAERIQAEKHLVERDLLAAKPALDEAENALKAIQQKDLQNLKALKNPPELIKRIFDGVLILLKRPVNPVEMVEVKGKLQIKDTWSNSLKVMAEPDFLNQLLNFPRDRLNDETIELLLPYLEMDDFTFEHAKKASGNVAGLCAWVRAMAVYHEVAKVVAPKMEALQLAERKVEVANANLQGAVDELAESQAELDRMQAAFDSAMADKQRTQDRADATKLKMDTANDLLSGLASEKKRWSEDSAKFADDLRLLVGDAAIAAAFLSYCGPFNQEFREMLVRDKFLADAKERGLSTTEKLSVTEMLADDGERGDWSLQGLPSDEQSVENAIVTMRSNRYPILIDPQGQGLEWLKNNKAANLRVTNLGDRSFRAHLEECMSLGKPLLIEDVPEELDPVLDPVLDRQVIRSGRSFKMILGDKEVDFSESFELYMTTKLANPHFSPELCARTAVVDFTVTMRGLESQLLGRVISKEKAELETQRHQLLEDVNSFKKKIQALEEDLLTRLSASEGNLLDDTALVEVLADTKRTVSEVTEKLGTARETEERIEAARSEYRPAATRGSILYFLIKDLALVNPMYQTSLSAFLHIFDTSIKLADRAPIASKRIANIIDHLTFSTHLYVTRGLFERHKVLWQVMLASRVSLQSGTISGPEFNYLLKAGAALDIKTARKKPFEWISDSAWLNLVQLSHLPNFENLTDLIVRNEGFWRSWYDSDVPEETRIPDYDEKLTRFQKLLLVRAFREDRTLLAAAEFIRHTMGRRYVDVTTVDLEVTLNEVDCRIPIVCLLSLGSDPTTAIMELAKKQKREIRSLGMGQGQEVIARRLMTQSFQSGSWLLLQNCHLGANFMPEVELLVSRTEEIHPDFRLFLTSEPTTSFPIGLLQMSTKVTNEPPQGVKAGLRRSFQVIDQDMVDSLTSNEWRSLLFSVSFLHTVVQERRKFGALGFSVPYEFNHGDLHASIHFLRNHLTEMEGKRSPVSWSTLRYMLAEVQYGGKITDALDRRVFATYTDMWISKRVGEQSFNFGLPAYAIPRTNDILKIRALIEELPNVDSPELFGLHANADITFRANEVKSVISAMIESQPKEGLVLGGMTREDTVLKIVEDALAKMPADVNMDDVRDKVAKKLGGAKPMNAFLLQEAEQMQLVIGQARALLGELRLALQGTAVMTTELSGVMDALFDARVPGVLAAISWPAQTLGAWISGLISRHEQLVQWLNQGRPAVFWISGFHNPQGFLTAIRQEVARKHSGWALDDVVLQTEVVGKDKEEIRAGPDEGAFVSGLWLEGAAYDRKLGRLVDPPPKVLHSALPVLYITAVTLAEVRKDVLTFPAPVFLDVTRKEHVMDVDLRIEEEVAKWTLRGTALLCNI